MPLLLLHLLDNSQSCTQLHLVWLVTVKVALICKYQSVEAVVYSLLFRVNVIIYVDTYAVKTSCAWGANWKRWLCACVSVQEDEEGSFAKGYMMHFNVHENESKNQPGKLL